MMIGKMEISDEFAQALLAELHSASPQPFRKALTKVTLEYAYPSGNGHRKAPDLEQDDLAGPPDPDPTPPF